MKHAYPDCLERLQRLIGGVDEVLAFLFDEGVFTKEDIKGLKSSATMYKDLYALMLTAKGIQLLEFEWQLLPIERVKVIIVTDRAKREIAYGY